MSGLVDPLTILETDRLLLRQQAVGDVDFLVDLWSDAEVTRHLGGPRDRERLRAAFAATAQDPNAEPFDLWPVVEKTTGRLIGHCGLLEKDVAGRTEVEVVYVIAASDWGKGYATEVGRALCRHALEDLGLARAIALIDPGNEASERTAAALGMRFQHVVVRPGGERRRLYATGADSTDGPSGRVADGAADGAAETADGAADCAAETADAEGRSPSVRIRFVCPLIVVDDIGVSRRFYEDVLGQTVKSDFGENVVFEGDFAIHAKAHFRRLLDEGALPAGAERADRAGLFPVVKRSHNAELYFETDEIEAVAERVAGAGVEFVHALREQPWGQRVMRCYDPDGHIVEIGETMPAVEPSPSIA